MQYLLKAMRKALVMSQEQFGREVGVTPVTINRWENGKCVPTTGTQVRLMQLCTERGIDLSPLVVERYCYGTTAERPVVLYHGSKQGLSGTIQPMSRADCDFGKGFYAGTDTMQPLTLICGEDAPKFYAVGLELTDLHVLELGLDLDWAMVVAYHRGYMDSIKGSRLYEKYAHFLDGYDIVAGCIANDRLYTVLTRFFNGDITDAALLHCLVALDLGKQYVAKTERGCNAFSVLDESALSPLELLVLREKAVVRRKESYAITSEIEKKYRREGSYFDELLQRGE